MSEPLRHTSEQSSAPGQAAALFTQLGELTALQGKNYSDSHLFGEVAVLTPSTVAEHFPQTEQGSESASRTLSVMQNLDHTTGQPRSNGVVGIITFSQRERRDANLTYATHVNYHVISDDGETFRLERHVTEHVKHRTVQGLGRAASHDTLEQLAELLTRRDRIAAARKTESELDLLTVSTLEAQQITDILTDLNRRG